MDVTAGAMGVAGVIVMIVAMAIVVRMVHRILNAKRRVPRINRKMKSNTITMRYVRLMTNRLPTMNR
jgi:hypothetical protein